MISGLQAITPHGATQMTMALTPTTAIGYTLHTLTEAGYVGLTIKGYQHDGECIIVEFHIADWDSNMTMHCWIDHTGRIYGEW
jgi:hypothetical protein